MEIARDIRHASELIRIGDPSAVGESRRRAYRLGATSGLDDADLGRLSLVATELASNLVHHATDGTVLFRAAETGNSGVEVLSVDRGPGMASPERCLADGYSTGGSTGTGLGAVRRAADRFEIHTEPGRGTVIACRVAARKDGPVGPPARDLGAVRVCAPGEPVSGDDWGVIHEPERSLYLVADGLGHGPVAHEASRAAVGVLENTIGADLRTLLERMHRALQGTRGAAVSLVEAPKGEDSLRFVGVGNVVSRVLHPDGRDKTLLSMGGIVGSGRLHLREERVPFPPGSLLVMHSDGLTAKWEMRDHPELRSHRAEIIAGVLFRDHWRGRDDATVLVTGTRTRR